MSSPTPRLKAMRYRCLDGRALISPCATQQQNSCCLLLTQSVAKAARFGRQVHRKEGKREIWLNHVCPLVCSLARYRQLNLNNVKHAHIWRVWAAAIRASRFIFWRQNSSNNRARTNHSFFVLLLALFCPQSMNASAFMKSFRKLLFPLCLHFFF